jgi:PHP family Zn ribbon phosphoesterase
MTRITGNTYPVKDALKVRKIVAAAPIKPSSGRPHHAKCHECGAPSKGYYLPGYRICDSCGRHVGVPA